MTRFEPNQRVRVDTDAPLIDAPYPLICTVLLVSAEQTAIYIEFPATIGMRVNGGLAILNGIALSQADNPAVFMDLLGHFIWRFALESD